MARSTGRALPVPNTLMRDLHNANERFHQARVEFETQLDIPEPRHQERVGAASEVVRAAELELEAVTERIGKTLRGENDDEPASDPPKRE